MPMPMSLPHVGECAKSCTMHRYDMGRMQELIAACVHAEKVDAEIVECACIIELPDLKGREKLGDHKLFVLVEKEGL